MCVIWVSVCLEMYLNMIILFDFDLHESIVFFHYVIRLSVW